MSTYLLIDLNNQTTEKGHLVGGLEDLLQMSVWKEDVTTIAMVSGKLTGSGLPGTGTVTWIYQNGDGMQCVEMSQGRVNSVLRYAGYEYLILKGIGERLSISIQDEAVELLTSKPKKPNSIEISCLEDGVMEDGYFQVGSGILSKRLLEKGICSIYVQSNQGLSIARKDAFLELCVGLMNCYKLDVKEVEKKVPYLCVTEAFVKNTQTMFAGVAWDQKVDANEMIPRCIKAFLGEEMTDEMLQKNMEVAKFTFSVSEEGGFGK